MYARHRSPVTGYKSNSVGDEGSVRGRGFHNSSDYRRNYNRGGFGRGQSKQQFVFPRSSNGNDIFMEAGRLAAEYLVSKGFLPPYALSEKLPNTCLKRLVGNFQTQDVDEGRTSARPASAAGDVGGRRLLDENNSVGSRNYTVGGRKSFKNYSTEFNRESPRCGLSDRARAYSDVDSQDDAFQRERDEHSNGPLTNSLIGKINPDIESATGESISGDMEPGLGDSGKVTSPINTLPLNVDPELNNNDSDDIEMPKREAECVDSSHSLEKIDAEEDMQVKSLSKENNQTSRTANNLLSLCRFENVPTRTRSSLTNRSLKVCHDSVAEDEGETEVQTQDDVSPPLVSLSHQILDADESKPDTSMEKEQSCLAYSSKQLNETSSSTFTESALMREGEKIHGLTRFESGSSIGMGRGEKREFDNDDDCTRGSKKPREFASLRSSTLSEDAFMYHSNSEKQHISHDDPVMFPSEEKGLVDISILPEGDVSLGSDFTEKQNMQPGSFKSFDLNLMETSDVNENNDHPVHIFPVISQGVKQESPADIHLTMSSNSKVTSKYAKSSFDGTDVEVIDLENDSDHEDKAFNNPVGRSEAVFTGTDAFTNNAHNANNIANSQDGYGLMISELLENDIPSCSSLPADMNSLHSDIPSCSSLPADMNSLHSDMGLHNGEGMLGDDDSIYMSLGEIPISFLTAWEQPTQEFGKPF